MATTTVYSQDGGWAYGESTTYATARDTVTSHDHTYCKHGQKLVSTTYSCFEGFVEFDTSGLGAGSTVTTATFSLWPLGTSLSQNFTITVAAYDWGADVDNTDYRTAAQLTAMTTLATYDTASGWASSGYHVFSSTGSILAAINTTGVTRFIVFSDRHAAGTAPTGDEDISSYNFETAGKEPRLYLEYTPAASGNPAYYYAQQ